jgi:hypothetical protein
MFKLPMFWMVKFISWLLRPALIPVGSDDGVKATAVALASMTERKISE